MRVPTEHIESVNSDLSKDDQEQLEYIRKWQERKRRKKLHLSFAIGYFKVAVEELILYFKGGEK